MTPEVENIYQEAKAALSHSYAPYSQLHVACVLKLTDGLPVVVGVNVENASFGGTICAERSAVVSAISQFGKKAQFEWAVIVSDKPGEPIPPCGMCLQVLREFVSDDFMVYLGNNLGVQKQFKFKQLFPHSFSGEMLPE